MEKKRLNVDIQEVRVDSGVSMRIGAGGDGGINTIPSGVVGSVMIGCHGSMTTPTQNQSPSDIAEFATAVASHPGNGMVLSASIGAAAATFLGSGGSVPYTVANAFVVGAATCPTCH